VPAIAPPFEKPCSTTFVQRSAAARTTATAAV
jgi:hypothetical protein